MSKDLLQEVSIESEENEELRDILRQTFLDPDFESKWLPIKIQFVTNKMLEAKYEEKKQDFLVRGRKAEEMEDMFGFLVENNVTALHALCTTGLEGRDSDYNALGYNCMGVYLCRHADVALQHALVKYSASNVVRLVICKYMSGRKTTAIPRVASAAEFIEPTQGFDSHFSVIPPRHTDSLQNQYDRSQVYLYEINKLLQPSTHPRQILPFAVVTFTLDGVHNPSVDVPDPPVVAVGGSERRVTTNVSEPVGGNAKLQQIIDQINARTEGGGGRSNERDVATPPQMIGRLVRGGGGGGGGFSRMGSEERDWKEGGRERVEEADDNTEAGRLKKVINQINARLESEEQNKLGQAVAGLGSHGFMPQGIPEEMRGFPLGRMPTGGQLSHRGLVPGGGGRGGIMSRTAGGLFLQGGAQLSPANGGGAMMELVAGSNGLMRPVRNDYSGQNQLRPVVASSSVRQQHFISPGYQLGGFPGGGQIGGVSVSQAFAQSELNAALLSGGFINMSGAGSGAGTNFQFDLDQAAAAAAGGAYGAAAYQTMSSGVNHSMLSSGGYGGLRMDPAGLSAAALGGGGGGGVGGAGLNGSAAMYQQMDFLSGRMITDTGASARDKATTAVGGGAYFSVINPATACSTPTGYTLLHQGIKRSLNELAGAGYGGAASADKRPRYF